MKYTYANAKSFYSELSDDATENKQTAILKDFLLLLFPIVNSISSLLPPAVVPHWLLYEHKTKL